MKYFFIFCLIFTLISAYSQEEQKSFELEGQFAVTTNLESYFLNVGGPDVKFNFSKVSIGFNFMPSLRFHNVNSTLKVTPILGTGIQFYGLKNKKYILSIPFYYLSATNNWLGSIGIGYVLSNSKKK